MKSLAGRHVIAIILSSGPELARMTDPARFPSPLPTIAIVLNPPPRIPPNQLPIKMLRAPAGPLYTCSGAHVSRRRAPSLTAIFSDFPSLTPNFQWKIANPPSPCRALRAQSATPARIGRGTCSPRLPGPHPATLFDNRIRCRAGKECLPKMCTQPEHHPSMRPLREFAPSQSPSPITHRSITRRIDVPKCHLLSPSLR